MSGQNLAEPSHEEIQKRAYDIYLARGSGGGDEMQDWIEAKRQLGEEMQLNRKSAAATHQDREAPLSTAPAQVAPTSQTNPTSPTTRRARAGSSS